MAATIKYGEREVREVSEARLANAIERNEERLYNTAAKLEEQIANEENVVNAKAIELVKLWKDRELAKLDCSAFAGISANYASDDLVRDAVLARREYHRLDDAVGRAEITLATIVVQSKLKSLELVDKAIEEQSYEKGSTNPKTNVYHRVKREIAGFVDSNGRGTKYDVYVKRLAELYRTDFNKDGDEIVVCTAPNEAHQIEMKLADLTRFGDAYEFVAVGIEVLNSYLSEVTHSCDDRYLLTPFPKLIESSAVYGDGSPKDPRLFQYKMTNAIKEMSYAIGNALGAMARRVETEKALDDTETEVFDEVSGDYITIRKYHAVSYLDLVDVVDFNGKISATVASGEIQSVFDKVLANADFTEREARIFKLRYCNEYTIERIADTLGISLTNVEKTISARIMPKICKLYGTEVISRELPNKSVIQYEKADYEEHGAKATAVGFYDSIGAAATATNLDKSNIAKCVRGKLKSVGGFVFVKAKDAKIALNPEPEK